MTDELGDHLHTSCFARLIRRKSGEQDREIPTAQDFGLNNFMRGWTLWELHQTDRRACLFSAPVGWYFLLSLPDWFFFSSIEIHSWVRYTCTVLFPPFCPICLTWCITNTISRSWHTLCQTTATEACISTPQFLSVSKDSFRNYITAVGSELIPNLLLSPDLLGRRACCGVSPAIFVNLKWVYN